MKFCPDCGSELVANKGFCPECGASCAGAKTGSAASSTHIKGSSGVVQIVGAVAATLAGLFTLLSAWGVQGDTTETAADTFFRPEYLISVIPFAFAAFLAVWAYLERSSRRSNRTLGSLLVGFAAVLLSAFYSLLAMAPNPVTDLATEQAWGLLQALRVAQAPVTIVGVVVLVYGAYLLHLSTKES